MSISLNNPKTYDNQKTGWTLIALILSLVLIVSFSIFLIYYQTFIVPIPAKIITGFVAIIIVIILASTYYYSYLFYKDFIYLFISIFWYFNALYLYGELLFEKSNNFNFAMGLYYLSLASTIPLFCSTLVPDKNQDTPPSIKKSLLVGVIWVFISLIINIYFFSNPSLYLNNPSLSFLVNTLLGVLFTIFVLFRLGKKVKNRLSPELHGRLEKFLPFTFYLYAALQPFYPLKFYLSENIFLAIFIIACLIKIANNVSILGVLLSITYPVFQETREKLESKSKLEEIGLVAASMEHDLKTPLANINLKIQILKQRLQGNQDIIKNLIKIEEDRNRIAAIATLIPFLRGGKEFYDNDRIMIKKNILEIIHSSIKMVKKEMNVDTNKNFFEVLGNNRFVRVFPPMIERVIINILKNSIEAIDEAGRDRGFININILSTHLSQSKYSRWVVVNIKDNGRGIREEHIPLLKQLFTDRAHKKPNSGIGLFISDKLMEINNGHMEIQSKLGEETTVSLFFPEWDAYLKAVELEKNTEQNLDS